MMGKLLRASFIAVVAASAVCATGASPAFAHGASVQLKDPCYMVTVSRTSSAYTARAQGTCSTTHVRAYVNCNLAGTAHFVGAWVQNGGKSTAIHTCQATDWGYDRQSTSGGTFYSYSLK
jgi:hypothetical protein